MMPQDLDHRPHERRAAAEAGVRLDSLVAASRHARVYSVRVDGGPAVLKVIADTADPVARLRFAREGRSGLVLRHPSLVETLRCGADWILLGDLRRGRGQVRSLHDRVRADGPDLTPAAGLGSVAGALAHLHARGFVHRDVKPGNIVFDPDGHPVLVDLGAVGLAAGDDLGTGEVIGSPAWMAPEQAGGAPPRPHADIYSLALVLAYASSGVPPFIGGADPVLRYRQGGGRPGTDFLRAVRGIGDAALRRLVSAGLSEEPSARPPADAFARYAEAFKS